jgi:hypothetical protein
MLPAPPHRAPAFHAPAGCPEWARRYSFSRARFSAARLRARAPVVVGKRAVDGELARLAAIITSALGTLGLGGLRPLDGRDRGETARRGTLGALVVAGRWSRLSGSRRSFLRLGSGSGRGRFRLPSGFFLLSLAIFLGAALFFLALGKALGLLAAARFLQRRHARFLGLPQQLGLHFLAAHEIGRGDLGFRDAYRRLAGLADDATALHLDHDGVFPPVAEALLNLTRFHSPLDAQRLAAQNRFVFLAVTHRLCSTFLLQTPNAAWLCTSRRSILMPDGHIRPTRRR